MRTSVATARRCLLLTCLLVGPSLACTCFCFDTPDGPVFGSNLDLFFPADGLVFVNRRGIAKEGFPSQVGTTGKAAKWISKYGSVTFNLAGREWAFGGMNEAGLVLGSMELLKSEFPQRDERPGLPIGPWAQYVLDTCGTVQEAIQVDSKVRIEDEAAPVHYLIADAKGNCVAIEWLDGEFVCYAGETLPVKAMSNMRYDRALAAFKRGGPRWWWSNPGRSAERFAAAHARSESYDPDQNPDVVKYAFDTLTKVVAAPHTKWCMVYDIGKRQIWYGSAASPATKHISLANLDLSSEAPLLMLDVNAQIEGDVERHFRPYDSAVNLKVLRTLCERYGMSISEEEARGIVRHLDSFKPVR
ncbi:MAG: linear amide C-N hydrolase [Phycisphaerales bacterium]